jgi:DNA N-6-adenine-methyltransferase (Dam)
MSAWEEMGKSDDWWTPAYIFDALGTTFDMDVATAFDAATHVPAHEKIYRNSMAQTWRGFIWMNAPFGKRNGIRPWLEKFFAHGNGIALVPDRTSAPWFKWAAAQSDAILFISPKVKFERPDGTLGKSPSTGTALIAKGQKGVNALVNARGAGLGWMCRVV